MRVPPLPRAVEADPAAAAIRARLSAAEQRLWRGGQVLVPVLRLDAPLAGALADAWRGGRLVLGLEGIAAALATQAQGLAALERRGGDAAAVRVSRLLVVTRDGAERFYRQVERLALAHAGRLLVTMADVDAPQLGDALTGRPVGLKAVLVAHKQAVAAVLRAIAG